MEMHPKVVLIMSNGLFLNWKYRNLHSALLLTKYVNKVVKFKKY